MPFGVEQIRKEHPAIKESYVASQKKGDKPNAIGFAPVDGQRLYKNTGGNIAMNAKPRLKAGGGVVTRSRPGGFKVRERTKRYY